MQDIYPVGQQDFSVLRGDGSVYIDKTAFIEKIVRSSTKYYFLARPRRFGKSLFLSTLRYFFEGRRELFRDLHVDSMQWEWDSYPVLYIDLNAEKYQDSDVLDSVLDKLFDKWERQYQVESIAPTLSLRLQNIIESAHTHTGRPVVILVDEYDKPLVGNLSSDSNFETYRNKLASVYSNFKSSAEHIRLVFMTGVSRFSKLSVFSDLNNLMDITFSEHFADICGITESEMLDNFHIGIQQLADKRGVTFHEGCDLLKQNYDGYRFAPEGSDIYNPWSLLSAMKELRIAQYWNATGTATIVAETLRNADVDIKHTLNARWTLDDIAGLDLRGADPTALLYQAGYLTIGDYDQETDTVGLKIPNEEVRKGLFKDLMEVYLKDLKGNTVKNIIYEINSSIRLGEPEKFMKNMTAYFAGIPDDLKMENENNFHNAVYIILSLIGIDAKVEEHTSDGRIDVLITTPRFIYIIELKYDGSSTQALQQINEKQYALKFDADSRHIFKIGINFSSNLRRIEGWKIE